MIPGWEKPKYVDANNNFVLYLGQDTSENGVYPNLDANYLVANSYTEGAVADSPNGGTRMVHACRAKMCPHQTATHPIPFPPSMAVVHIARVTGVLPSTAASFTRDPKIPDWKDYEVR